MKLSKTANNFGKPVAPECAVRFGTIERRNRDGSRFIALSGIEVSLSFVVWLRYRGVKYTRDKDIVSIYAAPADADDYVKNFAEAFLRRHKLQIRWAWLDVDVMV